MKKRFLTATLLAAGSYLSTNIAIAWEPGPCPANGGQNPCIEVTENNNTYHINGNGEHAGSWYGLPSTGADFEFTGTNHGWACSALNWNCTTIWAGKFKKCKDAGGTWRTGMQINSVNLSGDFYCTLSEMGGFPWYAHNSTASSHCPFVDDCDSFTPYAQGASFMSFNIGSINVNILGIPLIDEGHMHDLLLTFGVGASITINSGFYDCLENHQNCTLDGALTLSNATTLSIY